MKSKRIQQFIAFLTCLLLMFTVAIHKSHQILGYEIQPVAADSINNSNLKGDIISTKELAKGIYGYGGNIPLNIYLKEGKIEQIEALPNAETPEYFASVVDGGLLTQWNGLTPEEALNKKVDAISGATFSSLGVIYTVKKGLEYAVTQEAASHQIALPEMNLKFFCTLLVILCALILPWFFKGKIYRTIQLILNIVVVGFWSGTFISLSLLTNYLSHGTNLLVSILPMLLIIGAFIYPFLGKKNHYCTWMCPMGSLQEFAGKCSPYKLPLSPKVIKGLTWFREGLWMLMMFLMIIGVAFEMMDYELFTAFMFNQASTAVLILGGVFILLSFVVQRPYCRFVCPTGTLIKISQNIKS